MKAYLTSIFFIGTTSFAICQTPPSIDERTTSWVGRWYIDNVKVCRTPDSEEAEGLLVYKPKEVIGYENACKITAATVKGTKTVLKMRCQGEGMTSIEHEVVEVVNGKLRRTVPGRRGERTMVFDYNRCP